MTTVRYQGGIPRVMHDEITEETGTTVSLTTASPPTTLCNASSNPISVTLPLASTCEGVVFTIKKVDATTNVVTILPSGSDTIDGVTSHTISQQFVSYIFQSDGTTWVRLDVDYSLIQSEASARLLADSSLQAEISALSPPSSYGVTSSASVAANDEVFADTTSGIITLTLPATAITGNKVKVIDTKGTWGTNKCTIARNGNKIAGATSDLDLTVPNDQVELVFYSTTSDWRVN